MLIKDLPKEIQEVVFKRQEEQGNPKHDKLNLNFCKDEGNFDWNITKEGDDFWEEINDGNFDVFYEKYPKKEASMFKKGDYIVCLSGKFMPSDDWNNICFEQRVNDSSLRTAIDLEGSATNGWDKIKFQSDLWRYASPEEIAEYDRLGKPYNVTTLKKQKEESLIGRYIKALKDYPDLGQVRKDEVGLIIESNTYYCTVDFPSQEDYSISYPLNTDIYKLLPKDYKPVESKPMTYEHSPFPTDGNYFKVKVIKDIIRKDIGTKGSLPDIIPAGSITWFRKEFYGYYNRIKNQELSDVCPENNRYSANIPAEYFEIIEDESKTESKSEIKLEKDKYYRLKFNSTFFIDKIKSIDCNEGTFDSHGYIDINRKNWINPDEYSIISDVKECYPATQDEIDWWNICYKKDKYISSKSELIEEAKKKYSIGTKFYPAHLDDKKTYCTVTTDKFRVEYFTEVNVYALTKTGRVYSLTSDEEYTDGADYNRNVCSAGKWADIVQEKSIEPVDKVYDFDYIDVDLSRIYSTTSNQSFLIHKSKTSLDTTVQKVSEISIELKQKSKTIKF